LLLTIVVLAFAVRLAIVLHAGERTLVDDETGYDRIALNVAGGHGYQSGHSEETRRPTASRGPSYILYVAAFYAVAGHHVVLPLVGQCVMEALSCLLAYWIAWRLFASKRVALWAAALYAVYPPFIINAGYLLTETFTNFTFLATIAAFLEYVERRHIRYLVIAGIALGLCALNKPHAAALGAVLALVALPALGWRTTIRSGVIVTIVTALVMTPWIVRNAVVFHAFIPGVTLVGYTFWGGTAPVGGIRQIGSLSDPAVPDSVRQVVDGIDTELERSRWYMQEALRIIKEDPVRYAKLCFRKIFQLWFNLGFDVAPSRASLAVAAFNLAAWVLAILGAVKTRPGSLAGRLLLIVGAFRTLVNLPATALVRYAMPYYALLFCFTAAGLAHLWRRKSSA
jgi:4-amino-4-deoxy-L-arabinose transferase-like glycosyltransferase